jgi:hypothetical protein
MAKYMDLCREMDRSRRYMSNAIGMCQREHRAVIGGEKSRIDIFLTESETYRAFARGEDLAARFDESRSFPAYLIWTDNLKTGVKFPPFPLAVDPASGVIRQDDAKVFGLLNDVVRCLYIRQPDGKLVEWRNSGSQ